MTWRLSRRSVIMALAGTAGASTQAGAWCGRAEGLSGRDLLPPMEGPIRAHDWSNPWAPATWDKAGGVYPWRSANVSLSAGELTLRVTPGAAASVQANDDQRRTDGLFELDATLPSGRPGLIIAPLYLYGAEAHEIDFEVVGDRGLQLAVHTKGAFNAFTRKVAGDFSGRRRYAVRYSAGREIAWLVDGVEIFCLKASDLRSTFPFHGLKPYAEIWPARDVAWAGRWRHADTQMILHGYRLT